MAENIRSHSKMEDPTRDWKISQKDEIPFRFFRGKFRSKQHLFNTMSPVEVLYVFETTGLYFSFCSIGKKWYSGAFHRVCRVTPSKAGFMLHIIKILWSFLTLWRWTSYIPDIYSLPWAWLQVVAYHLHSQGALCWWTCYSLYSHGRWQKLYIVQVSKPRVEVLSKRKNQTAPVCYPIV